VTTVLEKRVGHALSLWVERVRCSAVLTLVSAIALAAVALVYAVNHLGINANTEDLFDPDLPFRVQQTILDDAFPMLEDPILIVIEAPSASKAVDAARLLADRLRAEPEIFASVYAPGVGPFWERYGLLYREIDELDELAEDLARAQPFLSELAADPSLRGLFGLLALALEHGAFEPGPDDGLSRVFDQIAEVLVVVERAGHAPRTFGEFLLSEGSLFEGARRYVLAQPIFDFELLLPGEPAMERLREHFTELGWGEGSPIRPRMTGEPVLQTEEMDGLRRQASLAGMASFVLVASILLIALRSVRLIAAVLLTLLVGLAWTAGFAALAIGHLNPISIAFAVLFIGLGVDFGIHFTMRYQELRDGGLEHAAALGRAAETVGTSLCLCALSTAIGFYAFVPTDYLGMAELGAISGTGMLLSLLASLTVLPAAITVAVRTGARARRGGLPDELRLPSFPARRPRLVCTVTAALAAAAAGLASQWHFDANPLNVRDPATESVRTFRELIEEGDVNPWSIDVLMPSPEEAHALAGDLEPLPSVERASTLRSYVPSDQEAKLGILADVALFLEPAFVAEPGDPPEAEAELAAMRSFREVLLDAPEETLVGTAAGRLAAALDAFLAEQRPEPVLSELRAGLVGSVVAHLDWLRLALSAEPITIDDLPADLRERLVASDGRARVEVFPAESLSDDAAVARFVKEVRALAPEAMGTSVAMFEAARAIMGALQQAFVTAAILMVLLLLALWRSVRETTLALAPLGLAALFTAGLAVLFGIPLNFANVIVLPLLLGIGLDSGIHLVHRHRGEGAGAAALLESSTSRAVFFSSLTTIASFGSLAFTSHRGMATLGQLLVLGIAMSVVCNLVVLPALIALLERRHARRGRASGS
jgi:uncharacterized protein